MRGISTLLVVALAAVALADQQCPVDQWAEHGVDLLLPHEDCDKFYKCAFGKPVEQLCPAGLFYNIEEEQCDWRPNVDCGERNIPGTPSPDPSSEEEKPESSSESEDDKLNSSSESEDKPDSSQESDNQSDSSDNESSEESEEEVELQENGCPVNPLIHWLVAHEENCNFYYSCVWGEKVLRKCPSALHFNKEIQVCDWPRHAGCASSFNKHMPFRPKHF